ncbi:hypothetical protein FACS1894202_04550 [Clostridia bacterium]|nr:hypothetical protein FACS1894202_04550 [Clostridia bacterium]
MNRLLAALRVGLSVLLTMGTVIFVSALFSFERDYTRAFFLSLSVTLALFGIIALWRKFSWRVLLAVPVLLLLLRFFGAFEALYELGSYYARFIYLYDLLNPAPTALGQSITLWLTAIASGLLCASFALRRVNAAALLIFYVTLAALPFPAAEPSQYSAALKIMFLALIMLCVLRAHAAVSLKYRSEIDPKPYITVGLTMCVLIVALAAVLPQSGAAPLRDFPAFLADWWEGGGFFRIEGGKGSGESAAIKVSNDDVKLGGPNNNGDTLLFTVRTADPKYMYSAVYDEYTGSSWETSDAFSEAYAEQHLRDQSADAPWYDDLPPQSLSVVYNNILTRILILPRHVVAVKLPEDGEALLANFSGVFGLQTTKGGDFAYQAWARRPNYAKIREFLAENDPEPLGITPQLPDTITERTRELARSLMPENQNAFDYTLAVQKYLSSSGSFTYDLNAPELPDGADFVDFFLFESKTGYCTSFASSMVVMLRTMGIPARYCSGFMINPKQFSGGVYRVTSKDAHAWVEAYFDGVNWVEFDPTASSVSETYRNKQHTENATGTSIRPSAPLSGEPSPTPSASPSAQPEGKAKIDLTPWITAVSAILLVWLIILFRAAWRKRSARKTQTSPPAERVTFWFGKVLILLRLEGLRPSASESLDEFLERARAALPSSASELTPLFKLKERLLYSKDDLPRDADTAFIEPMYYQMVSDITANYSKNRKRFEVYITGRIIKYDRQRD